MKPSAGNKQGGDKGEIVPVGGGGGGGGGKILP